MTVQYRTWADHPDEQGLPNRRTLDRRPKMLRVALSPGQSAMRIMRDGTETPCCNKRRVTADNLVYHGHLPQPTKQAILEALPTAAAAGWYLCDGCRGTLRRAGIDPADLPNWKRDPTSARHRARKRAGTLPPDAVGR